MRREMLIAFFGGAFDPPHMGHYLAAAYYLAVESRGELWLMPSVRHAYDKKMAPFAQRAAWCRTMARMLGPRVKVSTLERTLDGERVYTYDVVQALKRHHPRARLRMLVGADAYADRANWNQSQALMAELDFFPVGRGARQVTEHTTLLAMPEVSSTEIRARLQNGEGCEGLVPAPVLRAILKRNPYLPR